MVGSIQSTKVRINNCNYWNENMVEWTGGMDYWNNGAVEWNTGPGIL